MELYPAIDVLGGRVVRLRQGEYADETVYGEDPVAVARDFAAAGAEWIHVVDLDAALYYCIKSIYVYIYIDIYRVED